MTINKKVKVVFFRQSNGVEPVREWLHSLTKADKIAIGGDIKAAEYGWPVGLPLARSLKGRKGLWEIRTNLSDGRIARVFFTILGSSLVLLHGYEKKSQKAPKKELDLAVKRLKDLRNDQN